MRFHSDSSFAAVLVVLLAVAVVAVAGATAMGEDTPSGESVLNDTVAQYANAESVVGTAEVTADNGSANTTATVEFATAGEEWRVIVDAGDRTYRAGTNETVAWYAGAKRTVTQEHETLHRLTEQHNTTVPTDRLNRTVANSSVELLREENEDGTPAYVLEVTHDTRTVDWQATFWVAQNDSRLLRVVTTDGTNRTTVDYRETQFNVSVHDSTFDPPADRMAVTGLTRYGTFENAQANTSLDLPELGASFREATAVERTAGSAVLQRYAAGDDTVTVASTTLDRELDNENATEVAVNGHPANVTTLRDTAVVYWQRDGVTTAVTVEASEDRAVELARRLSE